MYIVRGSAHFCAGEIERLRPRLIAYLDHVRGRDGCIDYCYATDLKNPNVLHVIESWRDEAANEAYLADLSELMDILAGAKMETVLVNGYQGTFLKRIMGEPEETGADQAE